jgi:electron transport complex protein RnfB
MQHDSYAKLADALEALPSGFPRMPSGVETSLLRKVFTEEEAGLAGGMSRRYEKATAIAERAGVPEGRARELLQGLLPRALVRLRKSEQGEEYRLGPFIVGWYEAAVMGPMRNDMEFANLFRQYMAEGGGDRILSPRPGVMGVVPARGSLKPELLQPYDDIDAHFARHERFGVFDCVCRLEHKLFGSTCSKPVKRCGFVGLPPQTPLSEYVLDREQAMTLFAQLEDEGHVHTGFYGFIMGADTPQFVGCCNCCGDCCGILSGVNTGNLAEGPQRSNYRAVLNRDECQACGTCVERCQVNAIVQDSEGMAAISRERCIGCGLCVTTCQGDAIELEPVSKEEWFEVPASFEEWEERRLAGMGRTA